MVSEMVTPIVSTYSMCQNTTMPLGEGLVVSSPINKTNNISGSILNGPTYVRGLGGFMGRDATEYFHLVIMFFIKHILLLLLLRVLKLLRYRNMKVMMLIMQDGKVLI